MVTFPFAPTIHTIVHLRKNLCVALLVPKGLDLTTGETLFNCSFSCWFSKDWISLLEIYIFFPKGLKQMEAVDAIKARPSHPSGGGTADLAADASSRDWRGPRGWGVGGRWGCGF